LEAMASGPVPIVTDIPGNRQWVTAATGHRFPVGDARALASAVSAELGSGAAVRLSRSLAARSLVHNEADWSTAPVRLRALADQAITHARTQGARS
jgi:glycosyltransferase involved in cell wall biosynthesis